jgi:hypothetical protein
MSATSGTVHPTALSPDRMFRRLAASFTVGAVILTISHPTSTKRRVSFTQASVSIVSLVIMDWTRTG